MHMGAAIRAPWHVGDVQGDAGRVASGRRYGGGGGNVCERVLGRSESPLNPLSR